MTLFRKRPMVAARRRLFGRVCIATPPSTGVTLLVAFLSLILLGATVFIVEVPARTRAIGVLMPAEGLLDIIATDTGQISELAVREGMTVREGQLLLRISSDRSALGGAPASESQIRSLRAELELLEHAHVRAEELEARRSAGLGRQITLAEKRMARADAELELQSSHIRLLEQRFARMRVLAANGGLAEDALDRERSGILHARAFAAAVERNILQIRQEQNSLQTEREQIREAHVLNELQHNIQRERLLRQIARTEIEAGRVVLAPAAGVIARVSAKPGSTSRAGEILMTLYKGDGRLEAWLYLPSDRAGQLKPGQAVQLRLDAYPHEMFGTLTAVVSKVSSIALLASDLTVPLSINGPVFEVRASISDNSIAALGSSWPLTPGTSFAADVVRQRYRLYQWLLRAIWREHEDGPIIAGS